MKNIFYKKNNKIGDIRSIIEFNKINDEIEISKRIFDIEILPYKIFVYNDSGKNIHGLSEIFNKEFSDARLKYSNSITRIKNIYLLSGIIDDDISTKLEESKDYTNELNIYIPEDISLLLYNKLYMVNVDNRINLDFKDCIDIMSDVIKLKNIYYFLLVEDKICILLYSKYSAEEKKIYIIKIIKILMRLSILSSDKSAVSNTEFLIITKFLNHKLDIIDIMIDKKDAKKTLKNKI